MKKIIFIAILSICLPLQAVFDSPEFNLEEDDFQLDAGLHDEENELEDKKFNETGILTFFNHFNKIELTSSSTQGKKKSKPAYYFIDEKTPLALHLLSEHNHFTPANTLKIISKECKIASCQTPISPAQRSRDTTTCHITFVITFSFDKKTQILTASLPLIQKSIKIPLSFSDSLNLMHDEKETFLNDILFRKKPLLLLELLGLNANQFDDDAESEV